MRNAQPTKKTPNHLNVFTVEEFEKSDGSPARSWTRVGVAFPIKDRTGYSITLRALPLDGRLVLLPPDEETDKPA